MTIKHVLVVDDSKSARLVLRKMLQSMDINVDMAASGEEALDYLSSHRPDAIFMDHTMPGMDGLQTSRMIKENPDTAAIPIAMYTSKEGNGYGDEVKAYGVVSILPKPATASTLSAVVKQLDAVAAVRAPAPVARPVAKPVPKVSPGASIEVIEDIARTTAETAIQGAIQRQILPALEERLAGLALERKLTDLRDEILINVEASTLEAVRRGSAAAFHEFATPLEQRLNARLAEQGAARSLTPEAQDHLSLQVYNEVAAKVGELARQIAEQTANEVAGQVARAIYDTRVGELSSKLAQHLGARLAEIRASLKGSDKLDPEVLQEIRTMVHSVALDKANESAQRAAEQTAAEVAGKIMQDVNTSTRSVIRRMYVLAVLILVFGLVTAGAIIYSIRL